MRRLVRILGFLLSSACGMNASALIVGVGTHAGQQKLSSETAVTLLGAAGFSSFRDEFYWHRIERESGALVVAHDLDELEQLVDRTRASAPALLVLGYGNPHYDGGRQPNTEQGRDGFKRYASFIAKRYGDKVYGFEIWNEWNIGTGNDRKISRYGSPDEYFKLVQSTSPEIRKSAPRAKISCGAVADRDLVWIERILELGILDYCDSISVHPYVFGERIRRRPVNVFTWVDTVYELMKRHGAGPDKKILLTEIGWPNQRGPGGSDPSLTAMYFAQSLFMAKDREWIEGLWWYELVDSGTNDLEREHNFGLVKNGLEKKAAFATARALAAIVSEGRKVGGGKVRGPISWIRISLPDGREATAFWSLDGIFRTLALKRIGGSSGLETVSGPAPSFVDSVANVVVTENPLVLRHSKGALVFEE